MVDIQKEGDTRITGGKLEESQEKFFDKVSYPDPMVEDQTAVYRSRKNADYGERLDALNSDAFELLEQDSKETEYLLADGGYDDPELPTGDPGIDELEKALEKGYPDDPLATPTDETLESFIDQLDLMAEAYTTPEDAYRRAITDGGRREMPEGDFLPEVMDHQARLDVDPEENNNKPLSVNHPIAMYEQERPGESLEDEDEGVPPSQYEERETRR